MLESRLADRRSLGLGQDLNIGCVLVELGRLNEEDVERILFRQRTKYYLFGDIAKSMGLTTDDDIRAALEYQQRKGRGADAVRKWPDELIMATPSKSPDADVFRDLRLQLSQSWFAHGHKSLAFISVDEKIGTSLFIANLALTFAQSNHSTLLIDANLRRPSQHVIFNVSSNTGLADVLSESEATHFSPPKFVFRNLSVLSAGRTTATSDELLSGSRFSALIKHLSSIFDITLIDLPSLHLGVDALDVAAQVGGSIVVTRTHRTRIAEISNVERKLKHLGVQVVGSVLIDV